MIGIWQREPIEVFGSGVARDCSNRDANLRSGAPNCWIWCNTPTMTSGPGVVPGSGWCNDGITIDLVSPLTIVVIFDRLHRCADRRFFLPAHRHLMDGPAPWQTPSRSEVVHLGCQRPRIAIVIVLVPFDIEKREACFCVADGKVERCVVRKLFDDELLERRGQHSW